METLTLVLFFGVLFATAAWGFKTVAWKMFFYGYTFCFALRVIDRVREDPFLDISVFWPFLFAVAAVCMAYDTSAKHTKRLKGEHEDVK